MIKKIEYIVINSTGNSNDFGDLREEIEELENWKPTKEDMRKWREDNLTIEDWEILRKFFLDKIQNLEKKIEIQDKIIEKLC